MRREPYGVGSLIHAVKRGARGLSFLKNKTDFDRLLLMLAHFNDKPARDNWYRDLQDEGKISTFERARNWPNKKPLVNIHAFCLHANHFHLLMEEITEGGISLFMQKIGTGLATYLNEKYNEYGSPFQGSYKSKTVDTDEYLQYVSAYIQVKNAFEQFPGGYDAASSNFDAAYAWSLMFPYSSLGDTTRRSDLHNRGIVVNSLLPRIWTPAKYKNFSRDVIEGRAHMGTDDPNSFRGAFL